jgi:hypothetical protein
MAENDQSMLAAEGAQGLPNGDRSNGWLETATAITLAAAGLLSAWATFQGGLWDKREQEAQALANSRLTESSRLFVVAGQEQGVASALFLQWMDAASHAQALRADVIAANLPPHFAPRFRAWRAALPSDLARLPSNTELPDFTGPSLATARAKQAAADHARRAAERAGLVGDTYDAANVVLATALFLTGIATILRATRARFLVVALGGLLAVAALGTMLLAPALAPAWALS